MILSEVMRGSLCGFGKGHQISVKPWAEGMHPFAFLVRLKLAIWRRADALKRILIIKYLLFSMC